MIQNPFIFFCLDNQQYTKTAKNIGKTGKAKSHSIIECFMCQLNKGQLFITIAFIES